MCIFCNLDKDDKGKGVAVAEAFLAAFWRARIAMREATSAMLACSQIDSRYDRTHKAMVRACRAWNQFEQEREHV